MLAENVEGIANATETVEMLNQAQENLQEVAKNPGIVGTWLQGLIPDSPHLFSKPCSGSFEFCISGCSFDYHLYCRKQDH